MEVVDRIREAALREFAQYGYDGARLERIARAAGVHTAQIHYYFRNKRGLYEAIQAQLAPPSLEEVLVPLRAREKPLPERVQAFYKAFYEALRGLSLPSEGLSSGMLPPLLLSPKPLQVPEWVEGLQAAQQVGLVRALPIPVILAQQWSLALLPVWFAQPVEQWEAYYRDQAPKLFWETVRGV